MSKARPRKPGKARPCKLRRVPAVRILWESGNPATVSALTEAEVQAWRADIATRMAALERQWKDSNGTDDAALLGALIFCEVQLPQWMFAALKQKLIEPMPQEPSLHWGRWLLVQEGKQRGLSLRKAYKYASDQCKGTPYAGTSRAMKDSYDIVQKERRGGKKQVAPFRS